MSVLYALSVLNPACVLVSHTHTCICLSSQKKRKSTCKAFKYETRSYCLSSLATLRRIACTVLCCAVHDRSVEFFGGRSEEKKETVLVWQCYPRADRRGGQDSSVAWVTPNSLKQWNVSVVCLVTEELKDFNGKSSPLCVRVLRPQ